MGSLHVCDIVFHIAYTRVNTRVVARALDDISMSLSSCSARLNGLRIIANS